jgi:hypothetical protein
MNKNFGAIVENFILDQRILILFIISLGLSLAEAHHIATLYPERVNPFLRFALITFVGWITTLSIPRTIVEIKKNKKPEHYAMLGFSILVSLVINGAVLWFSYEALTNPINVEEMGFQGKEKMLIHLSWGLVIAALITEILLGFLGLLHYNEEYKPHVVSNKTETNLPVVIQEEKK